MTDAKLQMMMADVGEVLTRYHATVREVLVCGEMMYVSAFGQMVQDHDANGLAWLAAEVADRLEEVLLRRINGAEQMCDA